MTSGVVRVEGLHVRYGDGPDAVHAVRGVDLQVERGRTVGVVGESGSGKSTLVMALAGLLPPAARVEADQLQLCTGDGRVARPGEDIGLIYQSALQALNPVLKVGRQIAEGPRARGAAATEARDRSLQMLRRVGLPDPEDRLDSYPHELSGGMRQRVLIAMALIEGPTVIIADEPTTALDVTVQAQVLDLLGELTDDLGSTTLLVTHDLGVVAGTCDDVVVMYHGEVVEQGTVRAVFDDPVHPYTRALLKAVPRPTTTRRSSLPFIPGTPPGAGQEVPACAFADRCEYTVEECWERWPSLDPVDGDDSHRAACHLPPGVPRGPVVIDVDDDYTVDVATSLGETGTDSREETPLLEVRDVRRTYGRQGLLGGRQPEVRAVDGVSLDIHQGEALGLVGESGCGKSTLGRLLIGLEDVTDGTIVFDGETITGLRGRRLREHRRRAQMIYQDPQSSLNRRMRISEMLSEALATRGVPRDDRPQQVEELLRTVGMEPAHAQRFPNEFSGGQSQRLAVARSLAVEPRFLVADEAVSALDVSVQGQIVNLLANLRASRDLTMLFVSHDLAVVRHVADRVAVMYLGRIVEIGRGDEVFTQPRHPYTVSLRSAIPTPDPVDAIADDRLILEGDPPSPRNPPGGCRFHPRCPVGPAVREDRGRCRDEVPELRTVETDGHRSACHFAETVTEDLP